MSYKSKTAYKAEVDARFVPGTTKWTGLAVEASLNDMADSAVWVDQKITMAALNYDCGLGSLQEKTLTTNSALTISNPVAGMYYTLIKKGAFTLTLPSGVFSATSNVTTTSTTIVTFFFDGTDYYFSFAEYSTVV